MPACRALLLGDDEIILYAFFFALVAHPPVKFGFGIAHGAQLRKVSESLWAGTGDGVRVGVWV